MKPIIFGSIAILLTLTACSKTPPVVTVPEIKVVDIPQELYKCDTFVLPNPDRMTNRELSQLVVKLVRINKDCRASMIGIKDFVDKAKARADIDNAAIKELQKNGS